MMIPFARDVWGRQLAPGARVMSAGFVRRVSEVRGRFDSGAMIFILVLDDGAAVVESRSREFDVRLLTAVDDLGASVEADDGRV